MLKQPPEGRVSVEEIDILNELRSKFGSIFQKDDAGNPTWEVTVGIACLIHNALTAERTRHAEEKEMLVESILEQAEVLHDDIGFHPLAVSVVDIKEIAAKFNIGVK